MKKFEPYSRRVLKRRRRAWLRRNIRVLVLVYVGVAVATGFATFLIATTMPGEIPSYLLGLIHAALLATLLFATESSFMAGDRQAIWHVRGAWGEDFTRDELRRAKRKRLVWGWVDSINLQKGDLDHVVLTRRGGLVAIDSKWRSEVTAETTSEMAKDARRAALRAEGLARTLLQQERGGHRARGQSLTVTPLVVMWGAAQQTIPEHAVIEGVRFVGGQDLVAWLRQLDSDLVPKEAAMDALERLKQFRETSWQDA